MSEFREFVRGLPKAELHVHIEGTLEPPMVMRLAHKHDVSLPYRTAEDLGDAYNFSDLQSFLDIYYLGASVLRDEDDFADLMYSYLLQCADQGIVHAEIMFDPQTHTDRGIPFEVFMGGFQRAIDRARSEWGMSVYLIMCFLRHLPEESAFKTLEAAEPFKNKIRAVGLDSSEKDFPPEMFQGVFTAAAKAGYERVAHAGEEGPPAYISGALDTLGVARIDHGVRCLEDAAVVERLKNNGIPLTVCPLSNIRLRVFDTMADHPILTMLEAGLNVSVNSDDPPYFGGYLLDNFDALHEHLNVTEDQVRRLVANSISGSFIGEPTKQRWLSQLR